MAARPTQHLEDPTNRVELGRGGPLCHAHGLLPESVMAAGPDGRHTGTVDTADALFRAGKATYLEVLLAQQKILEAELELSEALRDQHVAIIRMYKATQ